MLGTIAFRILVFVATAYIGSLAILFVFQSNFIYPAPQQPAGLTPGYEEVELTTQDGLTLRAFYHEADQGMPTVLYFHGNGGTLQGASVSNAALVEAGIGVLLVEYRGYGGNPGSPSEKGLYLDGEAAVDWLHQQGVAPSDTIVVGNSIGGGVATHIATLLNEADDAPAGLILIAPFSSLPAVAAEKLWWIPARWLVRDQYDNRSRVAALNIPMLVQHGDADDLIEDSHGKQLAATAPDARFQPFARSGHDLSFERRSQEARRDWILSLDR